MSDRALGVHRIEGRFNPHCVICGRSAMQIGAAPSVPCRRATLPFDDAAPIVLPPAAIAPQRRAGAA